MNYYIITGTSRGLGEALANELIDENNSLFCISRSKNETLITNAKNKGASLEYIEYDLLNVERIDQLIEDIFEGITLQESDAVYLVNNAGMVGPIKPIGKCESKDMTANITLNTIAPMALTNAFMKQTENFNGEKLVINISSGAGKRPFFGWGTYCTSKAALDMFTKCVGLEQGNKENPVKVYSFGPGIVDTTMQKEIRSSNNEDFEQVERFIKFKEEGQLKSPEFVAKQVLKLIHTTDLENGTLTSVKEIMEK
ncbi:(S)-benzoin forming benzil reductase [Haloplasma contractile]|uniref:Oxidoreductase short-chain dehydrogenase-reductase family protein n=1 Tax=Haloplasma contractile SSD-17B TaxID=1033810 RepID=F7PTL2_9MOLU|nr:(S)-benzoin forming benzil reductase [Haloplasma contractile]ERJ12173.1 Oxidoreductase short-chain dehydrogenase-reductase family protein [Haloplasma contractile SSD-17B]